MHTLAATILVFGLAFLAMACALRGRHCVNCSCKAASRIMNRFTEEESQDRPYELHDLS